MTQAATQLAGERHNFPESTKDDSPSARVNRGESTGREWSAARLRDRCTGSGSQPPHWRSDRAPRRRACLWVLVARDGGNPPSTETDGFQPGRELPGHGQVHGLFKQATTSTRRANGKPPCARSHGCSNQAAPASWLSTSPICSRPMPRRRLAKFGLAASGCQAV